MKIENGKIAEATESELFKHYLDTDMYEIMSFPDYKRQCVELGTKIIEEE